MQESRLMPSVPGAILLEPIGHVRSPIKPGQTMPRGGVNALLVLDTRYMDGLNSIELNSHIWVLGWLEAVDRHRLFSRSGRGVFGSRSPNRPNPIGLTVCRLLAREANVLRVSGLDFYDGTAVVDIKRYSPSWDCIFSAQSPWEAEVHDLAEEAMVRDLFRQAVNFHGEACPTAALAARAVYRAASAFRCGPRSKDIYVELPLDGCLVDAVQGITGATFGSGRLGLGEKVRICHGTAGTILVEFGPTPPTAEEILSLPEEKLFHWKWNT